MLKKGLRKIAIVLAAAALLTLAAGALAQDEPHQRGYAAYRAGRFDDAIALFNQVVEEFPEWHYSRFMLGRCYKAKGDAASRAGRTTQAAGFYRTAIQHYTVAANNATETNEVFNTNYELADTYYKMDEYARALEFAASALRLREARIYSQALPQIRLIQGFSHYYLGQYRDAVTAFRPLVDAGDASANVLRAVASSYQELGDNANAVAVIQVAVREDPQDIIAHKILIKSQINAGQWAEAINSAAFALRYHERDWEIHYLKGRAHNRLNQLDQALEHLRRSIVIQAHEYVNRLLGDVLVRRGEWREATRAYNAAQREYANDPAFYTKFAFCWYQYVPSDAERYHGTSQERGYLQALGNATELLEHASSIEGADSEQIAAMLAGINNKRQRLEQGRFIAVTIESYIDPETGEIVRREVTGSENPDQ